MNLAKLFEVQKVLRDRINYNEPDRFNKLVLALLVELGECANEWRGFKFWSKDQEPRNKVLVSCSLDDVDVYENPLLEEYVDGLHFIFELGIEFSFQDVKPFLVHTDMTVASMFLKINKIIAQITVVAGREHKQFYFGELLSHYLGLGKMLGFTWEQIEQAYMEKNAVNHQRQSEGY